MTDTTATAKNLADWMTGLITTNGDYTKESNLANTTDLETDTLVGALITYFDDPITNPTTYQHSAAEYFDVLTGGKVEGISSPSDRNLTKFAKDLTTELNKLGGPTHKQSGGAVTDLESYFGEDDLASVIVDGLRVLKNLNAVSGLSDIWLKAKISGTEYWDHKGWGGIWKNEYHEDGTIKESIKIGTAAFTPFTLFNKVPEGNHYYTITFGAAGAPTI
jgi:hypothetical protein